MTTVFPGTIQTFVDPAGTAKLSNPDHTQRHIDESDTLEAIQTVIGTTAGTNVLKNFAAGDFPARINSSNVFQQAVSGTVNSSTIGTATITSSTIGTTNLISFNAPQGFLINGKIVPTVASNNLTVTIKGIDGNDPSATNPVYCRIGDIVRSITSALSVTKNAGTNWFNSGASELATQLIDYFVYLGYNATDGVVIGFARIPYAHQYNQFSTSSTNDKYCAISTITNAGATDNYEVVGRFCAYLSAGAGYTWTVPSFQPYLLVQRPVHESRFMEWTPTFTGGGSLLVGTVAVTKNKYRLDYNKCSVISKTGFTTGGTTSTDVYETMPIARVSTDAYLAFGGGTGYNSAAQIMSFWNNTSQTQLVHQNYNQGTWTLGAGGNVSVSGMYEI